MPHDQERTSLESSDQRFKKHIDQLRHAAKRGAMDALDELGRYIDDEVYFEEFGEDPPE